MFTLIDGLILWAVNLHVISQDTGSVPIGTPREIPVSGHCHTGNNEWQGATKIPAGSPEVAVSSRNWEILAILHIPM